MGNLVSTMVNLFNTFTMKLRLVRMIGTRAIMRERLQVLVVEDDEDNRDMLVRRLRRAGLVVRSANDAEAALVACILEKPTFIVLDLGLPGAHGLDLLRDIRADAAYADTAVVVLTADSTTRRLCAECGCDAFFEKPVDFPALLATIDNLAETSRGNAGPFPA